MDYDKHIPDEELSIYVRELEDRIAELEAQLREAVMIGELLAGQNSEARTERAELEAQLAEARKKGDRQ